jgi:prolipoprotein diacylglyceryl transferase
MLSAFSPAVIPSPSQGVWNLGPIPIRAYALLIILGIVVAVWLGNRRYTARGGRPGTITDLAVWAVPFGIVGGRLYHVLTDWQLYFGPGGSGLAGAVKIWQGGLGIWGAVAFGALGAWIGARRMGLLLPPVGDAIAPGIALAQAIGRFGNWFNQELFGAPTTLPWSLQIDPANRPAGYQGFETFHPTFLYESLWMVGVALVLIWADRRFRLGHGRVFALYVALYCAGRLWIEMLRIDSANQVLGLRLNVWTALLIGLGAVAYLLISARLRPGPDTTLVRAANPGGPGSSAPGEGEPSADELSADESSADEPSADEPSATDANTGEPDDPSRVGSVSAPKGDSGDQGPAR